MSLTLGQTAAAIVAQNKASGKTATGIIAGNIINDRLAKIVTPKLPMMVRGYVDTPLGKAAIANIAAGALIHFLPSNSKATTAASAMIEAAMVEFASSFNIESMVDELLDGVDLSGVADTAKEAAGKVTTGLSLGGDKASGQN